jgi:hypothetical protein
MQLYAILNELWRRRIVVGIALVVSVLIGLMVAFKVTPGLPPKLASRAHEIGVASTRVLINTPSSIVADLNPAGGASLSTHAQLLGNLLSSDQVHNAIAKSAGLAPTDLTISPLAVGGVVQTPLAVTAPAPVGASSVSVNADPLLPLININATAPTPTQAAALANGSVRVLQSYIQTVAAEEGIPTSRRPVITSLGSAVGLTSTTGPSKMYGAIAIILAFGLSCYVILVITGGKARIRELKELRAKEYESVIALAAEEQRPARTAADNAPTTHEATALVDGALAETARNGDAAHAAQPPVHHRGAVDLTCELLRPDGDPPPEDGPAPYRDPPPDGGAPTAGDRASPTRQRALLLDAVHVFGIETLEPGDRDLELRLAGVGIDVCKPSTAEVIGRLGWNEVRSVAVQRPRRGLPGRRRPALLVAGTDRGEVTFELPGVSDDAITEHLEPLIARNCVGCARAGPDAVQPVQPELAAASPLSSQ